MKNVTLIALICFGGLFAQQSEIQTARDGFITIATDARALGQGDIGVATSPDVFSQFWNPSKYVFSEKKTLVGFTQFFGSNEELGPLKQMNLCFYNQLDERSAYGVSFRGYSTDNGNQFEQANFEMAIDGSYTLRLGQNFAMAVGARYTVLAGKVPQQFTFDNVGSLYGVDVSGFYNGNEIGFKKFNGRLRAGFSITNLRGKPLNDKKAIEIYAPTTLKVGAGFDFSLTHNHLLAITAEYKTLLDSYIESEDDVPLDFGITGSAAALGAEFIFRERMSARAGYSKGINRPTDSFGTLGIGLRGRYVDVDVAILMGLRGDENQARNNFRLSLSLDLAEVLTNQNLFPQEDP